MIGYSRVTGGVSGLNGIETVICPSRCWIEPVWPPPVILNPPPSPDACSSCQPVQPGPNEGCSEANHEPSSFPSLSVPGLSAVQVQDPECLRSILSVSMDDYPHSCGTSLNL